MAYYNGQFASYAELVTVLTNACAAQGWTLADGILSKDGIFIKLTASTNTAVNTTDGLGVLIQGGTGKSGATLINPSAAKPRLGVYYPLSASVITFPASYHIFIFDNPSEVYCIVKSNINRFYYLAFGKLGTNGIWLSATASTRNQSSKNGWSLTDTTGADTSSNIAISSGFFWQNREYYNYDYARVETIYVDGAWQSQRDQTVAGSFNALHPVIPLVSYQPSNWSGEAVFLPIAIIQYVASSKNKILTQIKNARYIRIDNYEPEQILSLGAEKWMIFPFHRKNSSVPNGGSDIDHTGTFGWAIRYDGP